MISPVGMPYTGVQHPNQITPNQPQGFGASSFNDILKSLNQETTGANGETDDESTFIWNSLTSANRLLVSKTNDENSYIVSGNNQGRDFRTTINTKNVDPTNASLIEMLALQSHLQLKEGIKSVPLQTGFVDPLGNYTEPGYSEKMDFMSLLKGLSERQASNPEQESRLNLDKLISALGALPNQNRNARF